MGWRRLRRKVTCAQALATHKNMIAGLFFPPINAPHGSKGYHDGYEPHISVNKLSAGAFDGLDNMRDVLELASLNISTIEHGAFGALRRLETLSLRNNQLVKLSSGAFDGLRSLRLLFLDDNKIDYLESNALQGSRDLETVWMPGSRINCTHVEEAGGLNRDATCIDSASCEYKGLHLFSTGDGRCYSIYDNYECA